MLLADFSTAALEAMFDERADDLAFVLSLNGELRTRNDDASLSLHLRVSAVLQCARRAGKIEAPAVSRRPVRDWRGALLTRHGLQRPDGRALFRYQLTDEEYASVGGLLRELAGTGRLEQPDMRSASLFVIYCSEWFRREAETTFRKWENLAPEVFARLSQPAKAKLTEMGLAYWRRSSELKIDGRGRQFLLTLALEGGFSVKLLRREARGWLKDYLTALIRRGLAEPQPSIETIMAIATAEAQILRDAYREPDFFALCAEVTLILVQLRHRADRESPRGVDPITYLDAVDPQWRNAVPIYLPNDDDGLARDLLNGLLREAPTRLLFGDVSTTRLLLRSKEEWVPCLQLAANGTMDGAAMAAADPLAGRVRAQLVGPMGSRLPEPFALIDPPLHADQTWRVRPLLQLDKPIRAFPFEEPVIVRLTQGARPGTTLTWRGGEPVRSEVLVFVATGSDMEEPDLLRLIGRGSLRTPHPVVYCLAPTEWTARLLDGETLEPDYLLPSLGRALYVVDAAVRISGPDDEAFLIEPDKDAAQWRIDIHATVPGYADIEDDQAMLCVAPASVHLIEAGRSRQVKSGELFWRHVGGYWREVSSPILPIGLIEVSWRDPISGTQRDKVRLAILPEGAQIKGRRITSQRAEIAYQGLERWEVAPFAEDERTFEMSPENISLTFVGAPHLKQQLVLRPPVGRPFTLIVRLPAHQPLFVSADGRVFGAKAEVSVAELSRVLVVSSMRVWLHLELRGGTGRPLWTDVDVEDTMSLGGLRTLVEELLALAGDQDATVALRFNGGGEQQLRVTQSTLSPLRRVAGRMMSPMPAAGKSAALRSLLVPDTETLIEACGDTRDCWVLPEIIDSPSLVYLRDADIVATRPTVVPATIFVPGIDENSLISAMFTADFSERNSQLAAVLGQMEIGKHPIHTDLHWLARTARALRGLPASAIDALKLLPQFPVVLVRLLLRAGSAGDPIPVWQLQRELPFLWLALPVVAWRQALEQHFEEFSVGLQAAMPEADIASIAMDSLRRTAEKIVMMEPALAATFALIGLPIAAGQSAILLTLGQMADTHIRHFGDFDRQAGNEAERLAETLADARIAFPVELHRFTWRDFPTLLVPYVLVHAAAGQLMLTEEAQWQARRALRFDPDYVWAAYELLLPNIQGLKT